MSAGTEGTIRFNCMGVNKSKTPDAYAQGVDKLVLKDERKNNALKKYESKLTQRTNLGKHSVS
jgi:hypothetical protein